MILTYHEGACIRASAGDTTLVFGPISKQSKNFKPTNFGVDVAFVSLNHPDMNGAEEAGRGDKQPFIISGPGEYEVKDMTAAGFPTGSKYPSTGSTHSTGSGQADSPQAELRASGSSGKINTVYSIHFDGLSVMYLGALGDLDLPAEVLEMDSPDILIIPIGGEGALSPAEAQKLAVKLEAKIIIPVLYDDKSLKQFLKEAGLRLAEAGSGHVKAGDDLKPVEKLTVKPRDVVGKESEVVVLSA